MSALHRFSGSIFGKIGIVAALTLATNLLGFGREAVTAYRFGAGAQSDVFFAAHGLVAFGFLVFSAGALQSAFMPRYQRAFQNHPYQGGQLFTQFAKSFGIVCALIVITYVVLAPLVVEAIFDFSPEKTAAVAHMVQVLAPVIFFAGFGALLQSVLHAHGRFAIVATVPLMNNVAIIGVLIVLAPILGIWSLATGYILGASLWLLLLLPVARRYFKQDGSHKTAVMADSKLIWINLAPLVLLIAIDQVSAVAQHAFVSGLGDGIISSLHYAAKIAGLPIGIFAGAVATVFFPQMTGAFFRDDHEGARQWMTTGVCATAAITIPASCFLMLNSELVIASLMQRGSFDAQATTLAAQGLFWFSIALLPQALMIFLNRLYFAAEQYRLAVKIGVANSLLQIAIMWLAVRELGWVGVPVGTSIAAFIYATTLYVFARRLVAVKLVHFVESFWKIVVCSLLMLGAALAVPNHFGILSLAADLLVAGVVYVVSIWLLREPTLRKLIKL